MISPESGFEELKRASLKRNSLVIAALRAKEDGQITKRDGDVGMFESQGAFPDRKRSPIKIFRLFILAGVGMVKR